MTLARLLCVLTGGHDLETGSQLVYENNCVVGTQIWEVCRKCDHERLLAESASPPDQSK
jgi:hypothetical protein